MLRLYFSNRTESLAKIVASIMRAQPLEKVFAREQVIIQSQGMGTWLNQFLSQELGIVAGMETHMPASFVWRIARELLESKRANPQFDKAVLRWEIYQRLPELLDQEHFAPLKRYLNELAGDEGSDESFQDRDLYELSTQLADSLDAYQNYRQEWLATWDQGALVFGKQQSSISYQEKDSSSDFLSLLESCQAELWRRVYPQLASEQRLHRPAQLEALTRKLARGDFDRKQLPERLFVFGLSSFPPQWLVLLNQLGRIIDIHFLIQNPCRYYWGDVQTERQQLLLQKSLLEKNVSPETVAEMFVESNALLASWGRLGKDYLSLLLEYESDTEPMEVYDDWGDSSALLCIQQDILDLNQQNRLVAQDDQSIRFASCHSRLRELEALKDYLLGALESDETIDGSDIIIMMPNVQDYAPLIDAVFSEPLNSRSGKEDSNRTQTLSYAISDSSVKYHQPLIDAFVELLNLGQSRLTAREVMNWLELEAIRERFDIELEELPILKAWIEQLNIRWGLNAQHKRDVLEKTSTQPNRDGLDSSDSISDNDRTIDNANTWQRARQRLMAGFVFGDGHVFSTSSMFNDHEGESLSKGLGSAEAQNLVAKLIGFLDTIDWTLAQIKTKRLASDWTMFLSDLQERWFSSAHCPAQFQQLISSAKQELESQFSTAEFEASIGFSVVASALTTQLEQERVSQRFLAGSINFCTLMPMRSIPFKFVCLLGMNDGEYPRNVQKSSFDLLAHTPPKKGDRSRREDDRYLFLEALMSVRQRLYISYCGRDPQDNSERFPSVLVSELREYIDQYFSFDASDGSLDDEAKTPINTWTIQHRLQAFHPTYYLEKGALASSDVPQSFDSRWLALYEKVDASSIEQEGTLEEPPTQIESLKNELDPDVELKLSGIAQAFRHPIKYYYQKVLGLHAPGVDPVMAEDEPFANDGLLTHKLKEDLLRERLADQFSNMSSETEKTALTVEKVWSLSDALPSSPLDQYEFTQAKQGNQFLQEQVDALDSLNWEECTLLIDDIENAPGQKGFLVKANFTFNTEGQIRLGSSANLARRFWSDWAMHVFWNVWKPGSITRLITSETDLCLPALSADDARRFATELINTYQDMMARPVCLLPESAFVSLFQEAKLPAVYWGQGQQIGEASDYYFARAQSASELLNEEEKWSREGGTFVLPSFDHLAIYRQVMKYKEQILEAGG